MFNNTLANSTTPGVTTNRLYSQGFDVVPIYTIMMVIAILGNCGTIMAFAMDSYIRAKPSNLILLSLACADLGIAIFTMPRIITVKTLSYWPFGEIGCRFMSIMTDTTLLNIGIYSVILLSWDRYRMLSLEYSFYLKKHNKQYILKTIVVMWIMSTLRGIQENITWNAVLASLKHPLDFNYICVPPSVTTFSGAIMFTLLELIFAISVGIFGVLIVRQLKIRLKKWQRVGPDSTIGPSTSAMTSSMTFDTTESAMSHNTQHIGPDSTIQHGINARTSSMNFDTTDSASQKPNASTYNDAIDITSSETPVVSIAPSNLYFPSHLPPSRSIPTHIPSASVNLPGPHQNQQATNADDDNFAFFRKRYIKPIITYVMLVLSLLFCNLPAYTFNLFLISCPRCVSSNSGIILNYLTCLIYFNSCLNPILYALTNGRIRHFYHKKFKAFRKLYTT